MCDTCNNSSIGACIAADISRCGRGGFVWLLGGFAVQPTYQLFIAYQKSSSLVFIIKHSSLPSCFGIQRVASIVWVNVCACVHNFVWCVLHGPLEFCLELVVIIEERMVLLCPEKQTITCKPTWSEARSNPCAKGKSTPNLHVQSHRALHADLGSHVRGLEFSLMVPLAQCLHIHNSTNVC